MNHITAINPTNSFSPSVDLGGSSASSALSQATLVNGAGIFNRISSGIQNLRGACHQPLVLLAGAALFPVGEALDGCTVSYSDLCGLYVDAVNKTNNLQGEYNTLQGEYNTLQDKSNNLISCLVPLSFSDSNPSQVKVTALFLTGVGVAGVVGFMAGRWIGNNPIAALPRQGRRNDGPEAAAAIQRRNNIAAVAQLGNNIAAVAQLQHAIDDLVPQQAANHVVINIGQDLQVVNNASDMREAASDDDEIFFDAHDSPVRGGETLGESIQLTNLHDSNDVGITGMAETNIDSAAVTRQTNESTA